MQPFIAGTTPAIAEPYLLTSLAGHLAFADAGVMDRNAEAAALARKAADFILPQAAGRSCGSLASGPTTCSWPRRSLSRVGGATQGCEVRRGRRTTAHLLREIAAASGWHLHSCARRSSRVGTRKWLRASRTDRSADAFTADWSDRGRGPRHLPAPCSRAAGSSIRLMEAGDKLSMSPPAIES